MASLDSSSAGLLLEPGFPLDDHGQAPGHNFGDPDFMPGLDATHAVGIVTAYWSRVVSLYDV